jgi:hypothetical protein
LRIAGTVLIGSALELDVVFSSAPELSTVDPLHHYLLLDRQSLIPGSGPAGSASSLTRRLQLAPFVVSLARQSILLTCEALNPEDVSHS